MRTVRIAAVFMMGLLLLTPAACGGGGGGGAAPTATAWSGEDAALLADLQEDDTDTNPYSEGTYEGEHYARDLQSVLEGLDYEVAYLTAFQYDGELTWQPLLKVTHAGGNVSIVDAQDDAIVTAAYDGDGDGAVGTLVNQGYDQILDAFESLISTGAGNDGQYLIFEFDDYGAVSLADTTVGDGGNSPGKNPTDLGQDFASYRANAGKYVPYVHDCDDFCRELEDALEAKGYDVTVKVMYRINASSGILEGHAMVDVHLEDGDCPIDPTVDELFNFAWDGNQDGELTTFPNTPKVAVNTLVTFLQVKPPIPGIGSDGDTLIFEYEDFDDIPIALDPPAECSLTADSTTVTSGAGTRITLNVSSNGNSKLTTAWDDKGFPVWSGNYSDGTNIKYTWWAKDLYGRPLNPGTYNITLTLEDDWGRKSTCALTITVVAAEGDEGGGGEGPTCTGSSSE